MERYTNFNICKSRVNNSHAHFMYFLLYDFNLTTFPSSFSVRSSMCGNLARTYTQMWSVDFKAYHFIDFDGTTIKHIYNFKRKIHQTNPRHYHEKEAKFMGILLIFFLLVEWMQIAHIINYNTSTTTSSGNWRSSSEE